MTAVVKPPPDAPPPRRAGTGASGSVELAGADRANRTALLVRGGGASC